MSKHDEIVTGDLAQFCSRERKLLIDLLSAWRDQGLPKSFYDDAVVPMMNKNSGFVFLTNSDYQVCMMNGDKLEMFYSCSECGSEGFKEDYNFNEDSGYCEDCHKMYNEEPVEVSSNETI